MSRPKDSTAKDKTVADSVKDASSVQPAHTTLYTAPSNEADDAYYQQYFAQQAAAAPPPGMSYEFKRGQNQLSHYFDTTKHPNSAPAPKAGLNQPPQKRVLKKDLERFRKRKEEKKKLKNKWLYED